MLHRRLEGSAGLRERLHGSDVLRAGRRERLHGSGVLRSGRRERLHGSDVLHSGLEGSGGLRRVLKRNGRLRRRLHGSDMPCTISVVRMTANAMNTMIGRCGNA